MKAKDPDNYAKALPLFDAKTEADDASSKLDDEQNAEKISQSYASSVGHFIQPVLAPLGFDWKIGVGIIACTAAKETVISTLATIYSVEADDANQAPLVEYLAQDPDFNSAVALSLMVFMLLYMPCVAAMAVIKRETNSWKWLLVADANSLVIAYVFAFVVYRVALAMGLGA